MENAMAYLLRKERARLAEVEAELEHARDDRDYFAALAGAYQIQLYRIPRTFWQHIRAAFQCLDARINQLSNQGKI